MDLWAYINNSAFSLIALLLLESSDLLPPMLNFSLKILLNLFSELSWLQFVNFLKLWNILVGIDNNKKEESYSRCLVIKINLFHASKSGDDMPKTKSWSELCCLKSRQNIKAWIKKMTHQIDYKSKYIG